MKPKRPSEAHAVVTLNDELVAAIHGAFEIAMEIAVREVSKLIGQVTSKSGELRRENESLKERLRRAEAMAEERHSGRCIRCDPLTDQLQNVTKCCQTSPSRHGFKGDTSPADSRQDKYMDIHEKQCEGNDVKMQRVGVTRGDAVCYALSKENGVELPSVSVLRLEKINQTCPDPAAKDRDSPVPPSGEDGSTFEHVSAKQETLDLETDASAFCLDSIKEEDFSQDCMFAVEAKMLENFKTEVLDNTIHDSSPQSCTGLAQVLPSLSSEFPNIFHEAEPSTVSEAPPQVYGVHMQSGRSLGHAHTSPYACKICGQTFHLPSLLRRHYGQCHHNHKLYPCRQLTTVGSSRTRLQLYPPGCSPFRCPECNREFNRMENLKTHLRIHTGEMPFSCSVCAKSFRHSGALTRHFRIHTGEKPYVCDQCGKSFRNCGGLKFHKRSHSKQLQ